MGAISNRLFGVVVVHLLQASIANERGGAQIDTARLVSEIEKQGFIGALADLSGWQGLRVADVLSQDPGSDRFDLGQLFETKQCTLPPNEVQRCSCFEIFNMADLWLKHAKVDEEEYKQRYKRAVKFYHPDKVGGSHEHMVHLRQCSALLRDPSFVKVRKEYIAELKKVLAKCNKQAKRLAMSHGECYRSEVEMLHDCEMGICLSKPEMVLSNAAMEYTEHGIIERLVVLLDDSFSMNGWKLTSAKEALASIMPRIERTPTEVHFIRSRNGTRGFVSTQIFRHNDTAVTFENIAKEWKVCCKTYLWEYAHSVVSSIITPFIEVVIVTDGDDNDSSEEFNGPQGFNHMMQLLTRAGKQPRFRVYCVGRTPCTGKETHYRDLALATGGTFVAVDDDQNGTEKGALTLFSEEVNAPFVERKERAVDTQNRYKQLMLEGAARKYEWADALVPKADKAESRTEEL